MQAWLFKYDASFWTPSRAEALLTSVPLVTISIQLIIFFFRKYNGNMFQGKMLILDLQAELEPQYLRFKSFYGQPFIFCLLHNFGGVLGLYGTVPTIAQVVFNFSRINHRLSYCINNNFQNSMLSMAGNLRIQPWLEPGWQWKESTKIM